jgi:hypothetical protein
MPDVNWGKSQVEFIPGLKLSELFYHEAVRPVLDRRFPGLPHSAALIGYGSDVLGYDTPLSRDHMWGPRLLLFLPEDRFAEIGPQVDQRLRHELPLTFYGYPTNFGVPDKESVRKMEAVGEGPVDHLVEMNTVREFIRQELGIDIGQEITLTDWLAFSEQALLEITAGVVFHDDLGLDAERKRFAYYPKDIWLYLLACQWTRIGQEEAFVGRAGEAGDDLGSRIVASRLVENLMRLSFLMERQYAPYSKWFGTSFKKLSTAPALESLLERVLEAGDWQERDERLAEVYEIAARRHNELGITPPLDPGTTDFYFRPFRVIFAGRFADAIHEQIETESLKRLPFYGSVNQFCTTTDILESTVACRRLRNLYVDEPGE